MNLAQKSLVQFGVLDSETVNMASFPCVSSIGYCFVNGPDKVWTQYLRFFPRPTTQPTRLTTTGRSPTLVTLKHTHSS